MKTHIEEPYPFPQKGDILYQKKEIKYELVWLRRKQKMLPYAEGCLHAAQLLWQKIESNPKNPLVSEFIYPYIVLQWNHVTVMMKHIILQGCILTNKKITIDHSDLNILWKNTRDLICEIGGSNETEIQAMNDMMDQLDDLGNSSFAYNYVTDSNGDKHISGIDWDNLHTFKKGMIKISKYLIYCCIHFKSLLEQTSDKTYEPGTIIPQSFYRRQLDDSGFIMDKG